MTTYKVNPLVEVFNRRPIDRDAYRATLQRNCVTVDPDATREELNTLRLRLERKQKLLKYMLRIDNERQHKNLRYRVNKGLSQFREQSPAFRDYLRNGDAIQLLIQRIIYLKESDPDRQLRKVVGHIENAWCEKHPGSVWTGITRVAPDGATFDREAAFREARLKLISR